MAGIGLNEIEVLHGAGDRDIQGVDMKLVDFQRLVTFLPRSRIAEGLRKHILCTDATGDFPKALFGRGGEVIENDIVVFQPLRFLDGKDQRGLEMGLGRRFVLRVQDDDRKTSRLACFLIEFAGDRLGVGQQHRPRRLAYAVDEVIALTVHGAKAGVLQFEQTVRDFR